MSLNRAFRRLLIGSATGIAVFAVIPVAKAVFHVLTAVGEITSIAPGSQLETVLSTGDPFVVMAMYDDALLTGVGDEEIVLDPNVNPRHSLDFTIGDPLLFTFDETDDVDFGSGGYPRIEFIDGVFAGFDFEVVQDIIGVRYLFDVEDRLYIGNENVEENAEEAFGEFREVSQAPVSPD